MTRSHAPSDRPPPEEKVETILTYAVPPGYVGHERLDVYLTHKTANATRAKVQAAIRDGCVTVNGRVETRPSRPVVGSDVLVCRVMRPPPLVAAPEAISLDVVYEDDWLLVVNKPAGMVVHPAYGHRTGTLVNALLHHVGAGALAFASDDEDADASDDDALAPPALVGADSTGSTGALVGLSTLNAAVQYDGSPTVRPGLVHRIDKDTSGLLVVAKTDAAHAYLSAQFARHDLERAYLSLAWGSPVPPSGRIETHLARDPRDRKRVAVSNKGKRAVSHYTTLEAFSAGACLVEWRLETGRTHQIRAHAKHIGHPLLGDVTYGGDLLRGMVTASRKAFFANLMKGLQRQALHAATLGFRHPEDGRAVRFEVPPPADFAAALEKLRTSQPPRQA